MYRSKLKRYKDTVRQSIYHPVITSFYHFLHMFDTREYQIKFPHLRNYRCLLKTARSRILYPLAHIEGFITDSMLSLREFSTFLPKFVFVVIKEFQAVQDI